MKVRTLVVCVVVCLCVFASVAQAQSHRLRVGVNDIGDTNADLLYTPLTAPCRVIDTRVAGGALAANASRSFVVAGTTGFSSQGGNAAGCGIPTTATSVAINFVAVNAQGAGNLKGAAYPNSIPTTGSIVNYQQLNPELNIANGVTFPICDRATQTCTFDITLFANVSGTDVVADVLGYYKRFPIEQTLPVRVTAANAAAAGWQLWDDVGCGTTAVISLTNGEPTTPPLGTGSFEIISNADTSGGALANDTFNGQPVLSLSTLRYSSKADTIATEHAYIYIRVDDNGDGISDRAIFFIPANNQAAEGAVATGVWQTWDALNGVWNVNGDTGPAAALPLSGLSLTGSTIVGIRVAGGCSIGGTNAHWIDAIAIGFNNHPATMYDFEHN